MSDDGYAAFLNKANKDYSGAPAGQSSKGDEGISSSAHPAIKSLGDRFYTSDSDEPFVDVSFEWSKETLPDEGGFLVQETAEVLREIWSWVL